MYRNRNLIILITALLIPTVIGCDEEERLVRMAEEHLERQAEQNRRTAELQKEVAAGARQLVEADAAAREELIALQRDLQSEHSEVGRQRDQLEVDRRQLAAQRRTDPIIATAITRVGILLACLLPLVICWLLLRQPVEPADDEAVAELLLTDLVSDSPLLLPSTKGAPAIELHDNEVPRLPDETQTDSG